MPKKNPAMPATLPLAELSAFLDEDVRQIQILTRAAGVFPPDRGQYPLADSVRAIKNHYRSRASKVTEGRQSDLDRKAKADADSAEIALAEKLKQLCFLSDVEAIWQDGFVKMRQALQGARDIPEKLKPRIVEILRSIKLDTDAIDS
jgi:hypothetical protein